MRHTLALAIALLLSTCATPGLAESPGVVHLACHLISSRVDYGLVGGTGTFDKSEDNTASQTQDVSFSIDYPSRQIIWYAPIPFAPDFAGDDAHIRRRDGRRV